MAFSLESCFRGFCRFVDGRAKYMGAKVWTDLAFGPTGFFNSIIEEGYGEEKEHMRIDYIWRSRQGDILLAVEHENYWNWESIFKTEIPRLIDVKAAYKVGIFYPASSRNEDSFIDEVQNRIRSRRYHSGVGGDAQESYLFILGLDPDKENKVVFHGHIFDAFGNKADKKLTKTISVLPE